MPEETTRTGDISCKLRIPWVNSKENQKREHSGG